MSTLHLNRTLVSYLNQAFTNIVNSHIVWCMDSIFKSKIHPSLERMKMVSNLAYHVYFQYPPAEDHNESIGLSAVCDCGISLSYSLTIFDVTTLAFVLRGYC